MAVEQAYLEKKLKDFFQPTHFEIEDSSGGCGAKYAVVIVSEKFNGKPLIQRHRMVNDLLKEELEKIHAFQMRTLTPEQWEKLKAK